MKMWQRKKTSVVGRQDLPQVLDVRKSMSASAPSTKRPRRLSRRAWWITAGMGAILIVGVVIVSVMFLRAQAEVPTEGEAAAKAVAKRISKHYILPDGEVPALATITDKTKLTSPVFKMAENGDKILIYQGRKLAIVYRPSKDRIVAVVPVSIDEPTNITKQGGRQ